MKRFWTIFISFIFSWQLHAQTLQQDTGTFKIKPFTLSEVIGLSVLCPQMVSCKQKDYNLLLLQSVLDAGTLITAAAGGIAYPQIMIPTLLINRASAVLLNTYSYKMYNARKNLPSDKILVKDRGFLQTTSKRLRPLSLSTTTLQPAQDLGIDVSITINRHKAGISYGIADNEMEHYSKKELFIDSLFMPKYKRIIDHRSYDRNLYLHYSYSYYSNRAIDLFLELGIATSKITHRTEENIIDININNYGTVTPISSQSKNIASYHGLCGIRIFPTRSLSAEGGIGLYYSSDSELLSYQYNENDIPVSLIGRLSFHP